MVVLLIIAMTVIWSMPLLQQQVANREIDLVARRFIAHAQFARQRALYLGAVVGIEPRAMADWSSGWAVKKHAEGYRRYIATLHTGYRIPLFFGRAQSALSILAQVGSAFGLTLLGLLKRLMVDL